MLPGYTSPLKKSYAIFQTLWLEQYFHCYINQGGIRKGIGDTGKGIKKNDIYDM